MSFEVDRGTAADMSALQHFTAAELDQCSHFLMHTSFAVTPLLGPAQVKLQPTHLLKLMLQANCPTT